MGHYLEDGIQRAGPRCELKYKAKWERAWSIGIAKAEPTSFPPFPFTALAFLFSFVEVGATAGFHESWFNSTFSASQLGIGAAS